MSEPFDTAKRQSDQVNSYYKKYGRYTTNGEPSDPKTTVDQMMKRKTDAMGSTGAVMLDSASAIDRTGKTARSRKRSAGTKKEYPGSAF